MTKEEEEITRNLTLIEYYKEELKAIEVQMQYMQAAISDFSKAKLTVEQIQKAEVNSEILIPIGGGTFLNGVLKDNKISSSWHVFLIWESSGLKISRNRFSSNIYGISLEFSPGTNISENIFYQDEFAISFIESNNAIMHSNNFNGHII